MRGTDFLIANTTYGIDLSKDWTNSSLKMVLTPRPENALALNTESLWSDVKQNMIYCFGGYMSYATPYVMSEPTPLESLWGISPDGNGSGLWKEILGPLSKPFHLGLSGHQIEPLLAMVSSVIILEGGPLVRQPHP